MELVAEVEGRAVELLRVLYRTAGMYASCIVHWQC